MVGTNKIAVHEMSHDSSNSGFVKAVVSEQNGEISCSVEETNRIRALLGMKPLVLTKPNEETQAVENFKRKREEENRFTTSNPLSHRFIFNMQMLIFVEKFRHLKSEIE